MNLNVSMRGTGKSSVSSPSVPRATPTQCTQNGTHPVFPRTLPILSYTLQITSSKTRTFELITFPPKLSPPSPHIPPPLLVAIPDNGTTSSQLLARPLVSLLTPHLLPTSSKAPGPRNQLPSKTLQSDLALHVPCLVQITLPSHLDHCRSFLPGPPAHGQVLLARYHSRGFTF